MQIRKLLISHGGADMTIASRFDPPMEGFQARIIIEAKPYVMRFAVPLKQHKDAGRREQETRRVWRVLYHHLKAIFEASDSGVIELRELILPFLVTSDGRTVGNIILKDFQKRLEAPVRDLLT